MIRQCKKIEKGNKELANETKETGLSARRDIFGKLIVPGSKRFDSIQDTLINTSAQEEGPSSSFMKFGSSFSQKPRLITHRHDRSKRN